MTAISFRDIVSIVELAYYSPAFIISILLCIKHGFRRSSGWYFLIIFTLVRVLGTSMQLATINNPDELGLYIGAAIMQNVSISPLMLCSLGLLSRVISNINLSKKTWFTPAGLKFLETLTLVGLILGIVGGSRSGSAYADTGKFVPQSTTQASACLYLAAYVLMVAAIFATLFSVSHAAPCERRILFALVASLPFLLVRQLYSMLSTFSGAGSAFSSVTGSVTILLAMAVIMEMIVILFYEVAGITVSKDELIKNPVQLGHYEGEEQVDSQKTSMSKTEQKPAKVGKQNILIRIAKKTIFGRIYTAVTSSSSGEKQNGAGDVEMQGNSRRR